MALKTFTQISDTEIKNASIASLADKPNTSSNYGTGGLSAAELKARFDAFPKLVQEKIAEIVSTLASTEAGQYIALPGNKTGKNNLYDFVALFTDADGWKETIADFIYVLYESKPKPLSSALTDIGNNLISLDAWLFSTNSNLGELDKKVNKFSDKLQKGETALTKATAVEKRVKNLESQVSKDLIVTDSSLAYAKEVPARSAPYAEITKFGGMSYKTTNLLPYPYDFAGINESNLKVGIDAEQKLVVSGLITSYKEYTLKEISLPVGTYYLTAIQTNSTTRVLVYKNGTNIWSHAASDSAFLITVNNPSDKYRFVLQIAPNVNHSNDVVAPMLSKSVALPYEPYFEGLRHTKPKAFKSNGANLWNSGDIVSNGYNAEIKNVFENLTPNKPYSISWDYSSNGTESAQDVIIVYTEAGGFNIANGASFSITQEQINTFNIAYGYFGSNATSGSMTNIMLNEGETALPYTPYREPITLAKPNINGLEYGVNANAYNYVEWVAKKFHKVVNKVVLDGSSDEFWIIDGSYFKTALTDISTIAGSVERAFATCDKYDVTENVQLTDKSFYCASTYYGYGSVVFKDSGVTLDVDAWRAYIAANPITLVYTIVKPDITDLPDLPDDNLIPVEGGGTIIAENDYGYDVPSEITYQLRSAT